MARIVRPLTHTQITKAKPAVFGGVITDVKIIDDYEAARSKRVVFVVEPVPVSV